MLKISQEQLDHLEKQYPGIVKQIHGIENANLPSCPKCDSTDTAGVQVGLVGRSMSLAMATTKVCLLPNGRPGNCFCNACKSFFS
jgi:hypothetical protein